MPSHKTTPPPKIHPRMANLLPFTLAALERFKERNPTKTIVLGGVGPKAVEEKVLQRFPWIDAIAYGEGERMIIPLVEQHRAGRGFADVPNMVWRGEAEQGVVVNPPAERIAGSRGISPRNGTPSRSASLRPPPYPKISLRAEQPGQTK